MKPDVPPSYETAVSREAWSIIAPWIPSRDLCSACLVCQKWYSIFIPFLWGDPASHFGIANDAVYVALTRFKRILRKARLSTRSLTHTLHLPPALSEIYGGPNPTWLREVLEFLPNLQSLIVTKLPFFDHHSLAALKSTSVNRRLSQGEENVLPPFGLKLLLASSEPNSTSLGLTIALPRFPYLVYLDLSYTPPARDAAVLAALAHQRDLQVLKLRGVGLKDGEAEVLANAIGIRVRLLDIRDNLLTDMAVRSLMQACFLDADAANLGSLNVEDWPVGMAPGPNFFSLDALRSEDLDHELLKQLTNPLTGRLAFEDIPHRGLTHLYVSGNRLSVEGLSSLLKSERLHILDGGTADTVKTIARTISLTTESGYIDEVRFPGAEKLIPVLAKSASRNLTYLRVDHALITAKLEAVQGVPKPKGTAVELAGSAPLSAELPSEERHVVEAPAPAHYAVELPPGDQIFEMDATPAAPRAELIGDVIYFALSPPVGKRPEVNSPVIETQTPIRGEGPYAPEVVGDPELESEHEGDHDTVADSEISEGTGTNSSTRSILSPVSPMTPHPGHGTFQPLIAPPSVTPKPTVPTGAPPAAKAPTSVPTSSPVPHASVGTSQPLQQQQPPPPKKVPFTSPSNQHRHARIEALLSKRPAGTSAKKYQPGQKMPQVTANNLSVLHPCLLPNLRTLVLTNVPLKVPQSSSVIPALKAFISACADESALSHLLARTDYSLPPGRARHLAEIEHARSLFALRTIILEMESPSAKTENAQRAWQHSRQRISMSKSSTGDLDSENLWSAAENDFSFFGEEGEEKDECGIYQHDPEKYFPTARFDDKIVLTVDDASFDNISGTNSPHGSLQGHGTLNPFSMNYGGGNSTLRSPRNLPLGRNRRPSNESQRSGMGPPFSNGDSRVSWAEMQGTPASPKLMQNRLAPTSNPAPNSAIEEDEPEVDVVVSLAAWRKERKLAYEQELARHRASKMNGHANGFHAAGSRPSSSAGPRGYGYGYDPGATSFTNGVGAGHTNGPLSASAASRPSTTAGPASDVNDIDIDMKFVEGHWKGEIKVVRNSSPKGRTGVVDMYGNYFEKGYLYP
ncbi:uncharacterized protein A1O9_00784 [Exophiala aquamarina CBS 119918]|uniref:F-box domain-containing protein n=1 Tax=Exophiala aquamarina CBS 119918 TaxID=1182545 RepID=A0A072PSI5_9EURO|nr:uncharacterized protein A1O9_00784 [Exophiala aquamarina CBS 119918]KEF62811.1 hypothetical protein A1O9_00784 [Exophiala aquamarina CBS 119918]